MSIFLSPEKQCSVVHYTVVVVIKLRDSGVECLFIKVGQSTYNIIREEAEKQQLKSDINFSLSLPVLKPRHSFIRAILALSLLQSQLSGSAVLEPL